MMEKRTMKGTEEYILDENYDGVTAKEAGALLWDALSTMASCSTAAHYGHEGYHDHPRLKRTPKQISEFRREHIAKLRVAIERSEKWLDVLEEIEGSEETDD